MLPNHEIGQRLSRMKNRNNNTLLRHFSEFAPAGRNKLILTDPSPYIMERGKTCLTSEDFSQGGSDG